MEYSNDKELNDAILKDLQKVIDKVTQRLAEDLQNIIQETVYDVYDPIWYHRSMQLLRLFRSMDSKVSSNVVEGEVSPDFKSLVTKKSLGQHIVTGEALLNMINNGYGTQTQPYNQPRDFWGVFLSDFNSKANRYFEEEMNKMGMSSNGVSFSSFVS